MYKVGDIITLSDVEGINEYFRVTFGTDGLWKPNVTGTVSRVEKGVIEVEWVKNYKPKSRLSNRTADQYFTVGDGQLFLPIPMTSRLLPFGATIHDEAAPPVMVEADELDHDPDEL